MFCNKAEYKWLNNRYGYFKYKGKYYNNSTIVKLKDSYIKNNTYNGKKIYKYMRFMNREVFCERATCEFLMSPITEFKNISKEFEWLQNNKEKYSREWKVDASLLNDIIDYIVEAEICEYPVEEYGWVRPKTDWDYPELRFAWIVYIAVLITSLIFKQFYLIWMVATVIFNRYRDGIRW